MHISYIPSNTIIRLSRLQRIAELFSRRLQIQERLTKNVANAIMESLSPQGVAVVMQLYHLCMVMRDVEKTGATTITSCVTGCFEGRSSMRREVFSASSATIGHDYATAKWMAFSHYSDSDMSNVSWRAMGLVSKDTRLCRCCKPHACSMPSLCLGQAKTCRWLFAQCRQECSLCSASVLRKEFKRSSSTEN